MGRGKTISLLGLYGYDNTLFDNMVVPVEIDKDVLINNILLETAELEILYTNPDILKTGIEIWSKKRLHAWQRMATVLYEDYNAFIKIKRDEERTITQTRDLANTNNSTARDNVNAWDDDSADGTLKDTSTIDSAGTDTGTVTTHETFHVEGDSAITDAQDVLKKEITVRDEYNLYSYIIKEFIERFCLLVY